MYCLSPPPKLQMKYKRKQSNKGLNILWVIIYYQYISAKFKTRHQNKYQRLYMWSDVREKKYIYNKGRYSALSSTCKRCDVFRTKTDFRGCVKAKNYTNHLHNCEHLQNFEVKFSTQMYSAKGMKTNRRFASGGIMIRK